MKYDKSWVPSDETDILDKYVEKNKRKGFKQEQFEENDSDYPEGSVRTPKDKYISPEAKEHVLKIVGSEKVKTELHNQPTMTAPLKDTHYNLYKTLSLYPPVGLTKRQRRIRMKMFTLTEQEQIKD